jgi:hypothetical protein
MNMSRSMLIHANLPKRFWGESMKTACYLKHLLPSRALDGRIPFEAFIASRQAMTIKDASDV